MTRISEDIKNQSFSDYRKHFSGIMCEILDCKQYSGFGAILRVSPVGYAGSLLDSTDKPRSYNVVYNHPVGLYGFPYNIKEKFFALVESDHPSMIEGKVTKLVSRNFLPSNSGSDYAIEPDLVSKEELKKVAMRKENLLVSRKFS